MKQTKSIYKDINREDLLNNFWLFVLIVVSLFFSSSIEGRDNHLIIDSLLNVQDSSERLIDKRKSARTYRHSIHFLESNIHCESKEEYSEYRHTALFYARTPNSNQNILNSSS